MLKCFSVSGRIYWNHAGLWSHKEDQQQLKLLNFLPTILASFPLLLIVSFINIEYRNSEKNSLFSLWVSKCSGSCAKNQLRLEIEKSLWEFTLSFFCNYNSLGMFWVLFKTQSKAFFVCKVSSFSLIFCSVPLASVQLEETDQLEIHLNRKIGTSLLNGGHKVNINAKRPVLESNNARLTRNGSSDAEESIPLTAPMTIMSQESNNGSLCSSTRSSYAKLQRDSSSLFEEFT